MTSMDSRSAISSPASADGPSPCALLVGQTADAFGPALALASLSPAPGGEWASPTRATSGQPGRASLLSVALQSYLASRFPQPQGTAGWTLYSTTWKRLDTPAGRSIYRLSWSALRTAVAESGSSLSGWPTPTRQDGASSGAANYSTLSGRHSGMTLTDAARAAGWPTPAARDWKDSPGMATTGANPDGSMRSRLDQLPRVATLAIGLPLTGSHVETEGRGQLNPAHSRWLMGLPADWCILAPSATRRR